MTTEVQEVRQEDKILAMREYMENHLSAYTFDKDMEIEKKYNYVDYEGKSLAFINGEVNQISDCFIIYAIAILGCAEPSVIAKFLTIYKKQNPSLLIPDFDKDNIKMRLNALKKHGFLFALNYIDNSVIGTTPEATRGSYHTLYTAGKDAVSFMNSRLHRQIKPNSWLYAKQNDELLGIAASAAVFVGFMGSPYFKSIESAIFRGRFTGTVRLDNEFVSQMEDQKYYIGMMSVYLHKLPNLMTDKDYNEIIDYKLNVIRDYLTNRTKKGIAKMILVCESNKDMVKLANAMMKTGAFDQDALNNVHFTSASLVSGYGKGTTDWFLNLVIDDNKENGYRYEVSKQFI